ncbi:MAG TPA: twin-arginine translocase TatA/TatE family subunit [Pseudobdellovibrionaceae bacterium]|nr:twin-arginine translocase TatA/TatE family subunit [Pseudobdellovibrionaceae bacterium]
MGEFSLSHILILGAIFLIFFGPSRLPAVGQSLGKAIRNFKNAMNEIDVDKKDIEDNPTLIQKQEQNKQAQYQKDSEKTKTE